jgi:hypothetical protein
MEQKNSSISTDSALLRGDINKCNSEYPVGARDQNFGSQLSMDVAILKVPPSSLACNKPLRAGERSSTLKCHLNGLDSP